MRISIKGGRAPTCVCRGGLLNPRLAGSDHVGHVLALYSFQLKWLDDVDHVP